MQLVARMLWWTHGARRGESASETEMRLEHHGLAAARLAAAALAGAIALVLALLLGGSWPVAVCSAWDAAALTFLAWVWISIAPRDAAATLRMARWEDLSRATADLILLGASVASLIAVGLVLAEAGRAGGALKGLLIGLALASVALAWASVHTVYTLRYARLYYEEPPGGIDFHGDDPPDYRDLAYMALTIGMTFQVSDTDIGARPIRRTAVRHALLSYLFGAVIVAITINVVASLLGR